MDDEQLNNIISMNLNTVVNEARKTDLTKEYIDMLWADEI